MELNYCSRCGRKLTEIFDAGQLRKYCQQCQQVVYQNPLPAVAVIVCDEQKRILMVRRGIEPHRGEWCLPGGFIELTETPLQAAVRELYEETGLKAEGLSLFSASRSISAIYGSVVLFCFSTQNWKGKLSPGDDALQAEFFNQKDFPPVAFPAHAEFIKQFWKEKSKKEFPESFGLYVITSGDHLRIALACCQAGARVLQFREKQAPWRERISLAKEIRQICNRYQTIFIVNDSLELALAADADGLHLGQDDFPVELIDQISRKKLFLGISTHSLEQAEQAQRLPVDYFAFGPIFSTPTKPNYQPVGVELAQKVIELAKKPVVLIGGINLTNLHLLKKIGSKNVAMVRPLQDEPEKTVRSVNAILAGG